ncbi:hypothetical protein MNEG_6633 [Monoraphidium neglectum]|uniref:Uncharacterized protein n=1 Tax=Monoraphidium neglectum TaxID=145388 RepID=A0A0D2MDP6_9CHLO|nr:hypothetical protein MNEG_6633 [Monoraphidium neglectum]KIZ01330.1 hypothetical protein MNEG_6633 [Monoraphidium neglectum]|eukprot:XP_013900349.1 hypothetical protein MNEG_6633 [Monoraphidium neglectum]
MVADIRRTGSAVGATAPCGRRSKALSALRRLHHHEQLAAPAVGRLANAFGLPLLEPLWRLLQSAWATAGAQGGADAPLQPPPKTLAQLGALLSAAVGGCCATSAVGDDCVGPECPWGNTAEPETHNQRREHRQAQGSLGQQQQQQQQQPRRRQEESLARLGVTLEVLTGGLMAQLHRDCLAARIPLQTLRPALTLLQRRQKTLLRRLPELAAPQPPGGLGVRCPPGTPLADAIGGWLQALWAARPRLLALGLAQQVGQHAAAARPGQRGAAERCTGARSAGSQLDLPASAAADLRRAEAAAAQLLELNGGDGSAVLDIPGSAGKASVTLEGALADARAAARDAARPPGTRGRRGGGEQGVLGEDAPFVRLMIAIVRLEGACTAEEQRLARARAARGERSCSERPVGSREGCARPGGPYAWGALRQPAGMAGADAYRRSVAEQGTGSDDDHADEGGLNEIQLPGQGCEDEQQQAQTGQGEEAGEGQLCGDAALRLLVATLIALSDVLTLGAPEGDVALEFLEGRLRRAGLTGVQLAVVVQVVLGGDSALAEELPPDARKRAVQAVLDLATSGLLAIEDAPPADGEGATAPPMARRRDQGAPRCSAEGSTGGRTCDVGALAATATGRRADWEAPLRCAAAELREALERDAAKWMRVGEAVLEALSDLAVFTTELYAATLDSLLRLLRTAASAPQLAGVCDIILQADAFS